jgi:hypothetical protein
MSIAIMTDVWDKSKHKSTELLILLALADRANDDGICWPGHTSLSKRGRIARRQIINVLNELSESGELYIARRPGSSNIYAVLTGCIYVDAAARRKLADDLAGGVQRIARGSARRYTPTDTTPPHKPSDEPSVKPLLTTINGTNLSVAYEQAFGYLCSGTNLDKLKDLAAAYGESNTVDALGVAAAAGKRRLDYVEGVLRRWQSEGRGDKDRSATAGLNPRQIAELENLGIKL